jgi:nitrite reductase/ring-hydroxylating ferredoxin subunit
VSETEAWRQNHGAPAPGTSLGPLCGIAEGEAREFRFGEGRRIFSMLVVRHRDQPRAYVNACPHVFLPLTWRSDRVLSADGERLICSNHQAEFRVADGSIVTGPAEPGCALTPVPVHVDATGALVIGGRDG